jgi:FAD/FMN-containing dehydrogenase/Fe-S oxidoreductase
VSLVQIGSDLEAELRAVVSGEVRFDALSRALYSTDASVYQIRPRAVVIPKAREDVIQALAVCRRHKCSITMRGAGTSQAGQAIGEGIQIDCSKYLNRLLEVNAEERWVRVEPGIVLDELNAQLAPVGMRFAPDISTASRATIGGMMANNSAGARSVLYGKTIDHVLEQTVLLADGSIVELGEVPRALATQDPRFRTVLRLAETHAAEIDKRYPKIVRRVAGYNLDEFVPSRDSVNLAKIMVGSEGTLGIVLEAKLRLVPLPKAKAVMVILFADLLEALSATPVILTHKPSAVEIMDKSILDFTAQNENLDKIKRSFQKGDPAATLCVEFYADAAADLPPRLSALEADLRARGLGYHYHPETDLAAQAKIWSVREAALGLATAMKTDAKSFSFVEDTAVAPEKLAAYIDRFMQIVRAHGTTAAVYAHASVGCLHVRPVVNLKTAAGVRTFEAIASEVADLVLEFGGALSGEHGDGLVRGPFMERMFGPTIYNAFREVKQTFDPEGIFNPGKIVDSPPMTQNLRFGAGYQTPKPNTWFDYSEYGGMGGAVEMCSGVGACRKKLAGTMCPSYMVAKDETATTRGRANALRLAMTGQMGDSDRAVLEALDLCLECRACKAECPTGVDMARFKSEFLADYYSRAGVPLEARALGGIADAGKWAARFPGIANIVSSSPLVKQLLHVHPKRHLPQWRGDTFEKQIAGRIRTAGKSVTIFNDTFTNYYDPEIGVAAVEVLERGHCAVNVARPGCCGRPAISKGLLREARAGGARLVAALAPIAERGEPIVFLEPSCLSAVKEDIPSLLRGDEKAQAERVAGACVGFEEFSATLELPLRPATGKILLHTHCHQKSMGLHAQAAALLRRIPNANVVELDAGCCGMAGSFGYSKDHYDVSVAIASRRLIPAVEAMLADDVLVAAGTSCRHQVYDLKGTHALHPAVLLRKLMTE